LLVSVRVEPLKTAVNSNDRVYYMTEKRFNPVAINIRYESMPHVLNRPAAKL